jgi:hypothetical protein
VHAVHKITALTRFAFSILAAEESYSDALSNFPIGNVRANGVDAADDLVPGYSWKSKTRKLTFDRCDVGMTYAACFDAEAHLSRPWFTNW